MFVDGERGRHIPDGRFRTALDGMQMGLIRAHAAEFAPLPPGDVLRICLLLGDRDLGGYERAVVRWIARPALETRTATIADARLAPYASAVLACDQQSTTERLARLCACHHVAS